MSRLYSQAAAVLGPSLTDERKRSRLVGKSLKSRTYDDAVSNKPMTHLLVSETLKHKALLDKTLELARVDLHELSSNEALAYILLFELLIGKKQKIQGGGALKRALMDSETRLRRALDAARNRFPELVPSAEIDPVTSVPRFCRVNTIKCSVKQAQRAFPHAKLDEHVENLLILPPGTDLHDHEMVKRGELILQDKSSCFPVAALVAEMRRKGLSAYDAIDCCAAPGNKTTQLAAELSKSGGKLIAFDKSDKRFLLLKTRIEQAGAGEIVHPIHGDFLETDSTDERFQNVRTILLDPSCSGSGSYSVERLNETKMAENDERVLRLAEFQFQILSHALSFPQAQLVSYSTCSVFFPENERVVRRVLDKFSNDWKLVSALPSWKRRGVVRAGGLDAAQVPLVARADFTLGDETGGFFVALFERITNKIVHDNEGHGNEHLAKANGAKRKVLPNSLTGSSLKFTPVDAIQRHYELVARLS